MNAANLDVRERIDTTFSGDVFAAPEVPAARMRQHADPAKPARLMAIRTEGTATPIFFFDGEFGGSGSYVRRLATLIDPQRPFYNLRPYPAQDGELPTIERMTLHYLDLIRSVQPQGPYIFGGHCNGGVLALEAAQRMVAAGEPVTMVALVEPISLNARLPFRLLYQVLRAVFAHGKDEPGTARRLVDIMSQVWRVALVLQTRSDIRAGRVARASAKTGAALRVIKMYEAYRRTLGAYLPRPIDVPVACFITQANKASVLYAARPWRRLFRNLALVTIPGDHHSCINGDVQHLADAIRTCLSGGHGTTAQPVRMASTQSTGLGAGSIQAA